MDSDQTLCPVDDHLAPAMCRLFGDVFGHPLSHAEWVWKYGSGRGHALALKQGNELLAHFGGLSRPVIYEGRDVLACQVCDVAVSSRARASLSRKGPLYALTTAFLDSQIGWDKPNLLGFGFPTDRAFRVAQRLGLYAEVDQMWSVTWPSLKPRPWGRLSVKSIGVHDLFRDAAQIESLWEAMSRDLAGCIMGARTPAWLKHRYLDHPRFRYELRAVQSTWSRKWLGLVVLRRHTEHLEWVDTVAPHSAWPLLLRAAQTAAARMGLPKVEVWTTRSQLMRFTCLQPEVVLQRSLAIQIPANAHSPGPSPESLRDRWFLMAGDTDFR
jgi:hypothetical protein